MNKGEMAEKGNKDGIKVKNILQLRELRLILNTYLSMKRLLLLLFLSLFLMGCQTIEIPDTPTPQKPKHPNVSIVARSTSQEALSYPLSVYAFDESGKCAAQQTIASAEEALSLALAPGNYRIIALSGQQGYTLSSGEVSATTRLSMTAKENYATVPLQRGEALVKVGKTKSKVTLMMNYAVAGVTLVLNHVPSSVTAVSARLGDLYRQMDCNGSYFSTAAVDIPCTQQTDATWSTPTVYVFPGAKVATSVTLSLTDAGQTRDYSAVMNQPIAAATPYRFEGNYSGEGESGTMSLTGTLIAGGWQTQVDKDFAFGPTAPAQPTPDPGTPVVPPKSGEVTVASLPTAGTLWQDKYVVALVESPTAEGADILLISTADWDNLYSALSANDPTGAADIAASYVENGLTGWTIPTTAEAKALAEAYNGAALNRLNALIRKVGGQNIEVESGNKRVRYLCENATHTYTFQSDNRVLGAGEKVKNYHLRLVKRLHLILKH